MNNKLRGAAAEDGEEGANRARISRAQRKVVYRMTEWGTSTNLFPFASCVVAPYSSPPHLTRQPPHLFEQPQFRQWWTGLASELDAVVLNQIVPRRQEVTQDEVIFIRSVHHLYFIA